MRGWRGICADKHGVLVLLDKTLLLPKSSFLFRNITDQRMNDSKDREANGSEARISVIRSQGRKK